MVAENWWGGETESIMEKAKSHNQTHRFGFRDQLYDCCLHSGFQHREHHKRSHLSLCDYLSSKKVNSFHCIWKFEYSKKIIFRIQLYVEFTFRWMKNLLSWSSLILFLIWHSTLPSLLTSLRHIRDIHCAAKLGIILATKLSRSPYVRHRIP